MARLILSGLLLVLCFLLGVPGPAQAQNPADTYSAEWKKIDDLVAKGLPQSAQVIIDKIVLSAKHSQNDAQLIKALLYKIILRNDVSENATAADIDTLQQETALAREPAKSILESITAQLYWNYFQQNRDRIYQRTNTDGPPTQDLATWTAADLHKKIGELYMASIKEAPLLQSAKLEPFDPIIQKGNVRFLRPTMYDLLAHEALAYFATDEPDIIKPAYAFEITDPDALAPAREFSSYRFRTKDSSSLHFGALQIYQRLLRLHQNDSRADAFIDADLERINFVKQYGVMPGLDSLYRNALQTVREKYKSYPASAKAGFLLAQAIYNKATAQSMNEGVPARGTVAAAKLLLDTIASTFPESEGAINASNLIREILHPEIKLTTEKVNVPGQPFRTLVTYKNVSKVYFRLIPLTPELKKEIDNRDDSKIFQHLASQKSMRGWTQDLPGTGDYLSHEAEVKIDALEVGKYILLGSASADFSLDKNPLAAAYFDVSNISFISSGQEYFVLNRTTGKPLGGATVQVWHQLFDNTSQSNKPAKMEQITANANGYFKLAELGKNTYGYLQLDITYGGDRLFLDDARYVYNYDNSDQENDSYNQKAYDHKNAKIFLFTDRSIYRPGQLVYFKGIGVTKDYRDGHPMLLISKDSIKVYLKDVNDQTVDSLMVHFNDFGSIHGIFRLPAYQLNGEFSLEVDTYSNAETHFSVEEYKRPKFYTEFEKAKGNYRAYDTVSITGMAKAYAGNGVDGARVTYRVTRQTRFLYAWLFGTGRFPESSAMEITNGQVTTNADGKFAIKFVAFPDRSLDPNTDPVFDYQVAADVTDVNGETRSTSITVPAGYRSLNLQITLPGGDIINKDHAADFMISARNLSGEPQPVLTQLFIYRLQTPKRLIRERLWGKPDQFIYTRDAYVQYFPHDEYSDESDKRSWSKTALVFQKKDSVSLNATYTIRPGDLEQGWYVIEAVAKDPFGQEVKNVQYFQVYDPRSDSLPAISYSWNFGEKNSVEPGDTAKFLTGTSVQDLFVIEQFNGIRRPEAVSRPWHPSTTRGGTTPQPPGTFYFFRLSQEAKAFEYPVSEEDRGGYRINQFFVKDNRLYNISNDISVPWSNKDLQISLDTYRDITMPGSKEKWTVTISGKKGEKVAAEMLASMYDASLDQFRPHSWSTLDIWPAYTRNDTWSGTECFSAAESTEKYWTENYRLPLEKKYDAFSYLPRNYYGRFNMSSFRIRGSSTMSRDMASVVPGAVAMDASKRLGTQVVLESATVPTAPDNIPSSPSAVVSRTNFNETVFFYPEMRTDSNGRIAFSFTMPEALTRWKLMTLAHTKDLASGYREATVITQKDLMVQTDAPRFLREGDQIAFSAKIVNLKNVAVSGQATLQLLAASSMKPVDVEFDNKMPSVRFSVGAGQSTAVRFAIAIPVNFKDAVTYKVVAEAPGESDGEEAAVPVVSNRMLVTETLPLPIEGDGTRNFSLEKLLKSASSSTLTNYSLSVEYTANPAWYGVEGLPYLMEYPYECAEQTFNRYYANALATSIVNTSPKIKEVFNRWSTDSAALISNLQKNEALQSVLLEETPWVLQAKNETQQKKNIALLFDLAKMSQQLESTVKRLSDLQAPDGGFAWFKGGPDNRYITQYIVTGIGHLKTLHALPATEQDQLTAIVARAIPYLDHQMKKDYSDLFKYKMNLKDDNLSDIDIQYLYMRSFFPDYPVDHPSKGAYDYYMEQSKKYWLKHGKYMEAMIALSLYRNGDTLVPKAIIRSLKENAIHLPELGMFWKEWDQGGYWWYQAPVESQALMIEAFAVIDKDPATIGDLKTWLLKNKQTNHWATTKATAEACYALLLQGSDWLAEERHISIKLGSITIDSDTIKKEAGTGYFKHTFSGDEVTPAMGNISATQTTASAVNYTEAKAPSWGAVYWQYFENLDNISFSETPLKLSKKLFIEKNTDRGPVLVPVSEGSEVHIGDKIKVRIELRVDRDMEYVHMKDMRASCMEPTSVLSAYQFQDGVGYYESTKDVATHFFFDVLRKGTYEFEYPMFVTHSGNFSTGIATIQCMYAPEFTAHSSGSRISVEER